MPSKERKVGFMYILLFGIIAFLVYSLYIKDIEIIERVNIPSSLSEQLIEDFDKDNENFVRCIEGYIEGNTLFITNLTSPTTSEFIDDRHILSSCERKTISTIHSHKNNVCRLSLSDAYTLGLIEHSAIGVICEDGIKFYTPNSLEHTIEVI